MHRRDLMLARSRGGLGLALLALATSATLTYAQALDTPSLTLDRVGFFRIDLDVHAGASGAPNGFVVEWMKKADFLAFGWPADENNPIAAYCDFTGTPTLNLDSRSATYQLAPNGVIQIQVGDLFDETGVYGSYLDQLPPGDYALRVWAEGTLTPGTASAPSQAFFASTSIPECTFGFWKTHPNAWPAGCTPMLLGTVSYTQTQLLSILNQPAVGNGLISLAHQLIATKLNICSGSNPTNIQSTINAADAAIGGLVVPPVGSGFLDPSTTDSMTNTLDNYNNGILPGVVACTTPTKQSTWGRLKSLYR